MELETSSDPAADNAGNDGDILDNESKIGRAAKHLTDESGDRAKSARRIRELNAIDQDVTKSLQAAGEAFKTLTNPALGPGNDGAGSLNASKQVFEKHTKTYLSLVQSVAARLRRQIYALEEAGIIAPNQASMEQQAALPAPSQTVANARTTGARTGTTAAAMHQQRVEPPMEITNGGLGSLDVGWLNSRSDKVGKQMEAELWAQARVQLEKLQNENGDGDADGSIQLEAEANDDMETGI